MRAISNKIISNNITIANRPEALEIRITNNDDIYSRVRIYDCSDNGDYWYTQIGFNSHITYEK